MKGKQMRAQGFDADAASKARSGAWAGIAFDRSEGQLRVKQQKLSSIVENLDFRTGKQTLHVASVGPRRFVRSPIRH